MCRSGGGLAPADFMFAVGTVGLVYLLRPYVERFPTRRIIERAPVLAQTVHAEGSLAVIAPGTILQNRYLVESQIGEGGMGAVYVATDQRFGSTVALKETFFNDANLRKAFEREARLLNRLRHPALPRVSDHFMEEEGQFLVMEYIPGEDLSEMLKRRAAPFPVRDVLAWSDQLLDALDYLHTQQTPVIHRDIKPQNLKLGERNQIVLLDFGLAKGTPLQTRVTATGSLFGYSFNYAPIEQMQGTGTDPRSDLYSLGATLYHLLTGTTPPDALTRATAVLNGDPDPLRPASEINARVPDEVADVLTRSMEQSAARRFASAEEMRTRLSEASRALAEEATSAAYAETMKDFDLEQKTQLLRDAGATSPVAPQAREADAVGARSEDATFLNTEVVKGEKTGIAGDAGGALAAGEDTKIDKDATLARGASARASAQSRRDDASVVTRVRVIKDSEASPRSSRRTLGIVAALVVFGIVAAGVYSLTMRRDTPVEPPPTLATPTPEATPQQAAEASRTPATEEKPAAPQATPAAVASQPHHTPTPEAKSEKPQNEGGHPVAAKPPTPPAPEQPETEAQDEAEAEALARSRDWTKNPPTDEEMRRWFEQNPRRARFLARKIREEQRRQEQMRRRMRPSPPGTRQSAPSQLPPPPE
jgi:hypothetical protein